MIPQPYRSTLEFTETTLPEALRSEHSTKPGVWGVIRVLEGEVRYTEIDPSRVTVLTPDGPGLIRPEAIHFVTPIGRMRMQVDFYRERPVLDSGSGLAGNQP